MADGKVSVQFGRFLGYDRGENGEFVVNREQALIVKQIYSMFLKGMTYTAIARTLTEEGIPTPGGKEKWGSRVVKSILTNEKYMGDALLQKSYTVDFLTKKKKVNEGQMPQYYVEDIHEAIIAPEIFQTVQQEILKRGEKYHSSVHIFSSKIKCGCCGGWFGSKVWHSNSKYRSVIWQCNQKFKMNCATPHLTDEQIKSAFLSAVNRLLSGKNNVVQDAKELLPQLLNTAELERKQSELHSELQVITEMVQQCISDNAHIPIDQTEYKMRYDTLAEKYDKVKNQHDAITEQISRKKLQHTEIQKFISAFQKTPDVLTEFDADAWYALVDFATVYATGDIRFTFKNGQEI